MKRERIDIVAERFGRLVVIDYSHTDQNGKAMWNCLCDCGKKTIVSSGNLRNGITKSCGCLHKEQLAKRKRTHGKTGSRIYWIWHGMKARCVNCNDVRYSDYGGRGIAICDEWKNDFQSFYNWAMANGYSDELTIDRIDVSGNYEPSNCQWATNEQQANNKRTCIYVTHNGKTQTIKQWSDETGINYQTLYSRIVERNWNIERALTKAV